MAKAASIVDELQGFGLAKDASEAIGKVLEHKNLSASQKWQEISKKHLNPQISFVIHQKLFAMVYEDNKYNPNNEPNYVWIPSQAEIESTNLYKLMKSQKFDNLSDFFEWSVNNREEFWMLMTKTLNIQFTEKPNDKDFKVFDITTNKEGIANPIYYPKCKMNAVDSLLQGNDDRVAIVYAHEAEYASQIAKYQEDSKSGEPVIHKITLKELKKEVCRIADGLRNKLGLKVGDAVAIDMPMNWESVAIYLGIIKAGLVVVSIADSFSANAIEIRLKIANTKAIFTQDVIPRGNKNIALYTRVLECDKPPIAIVVTADYKTKKLAVDLRKGDMSYDDFLKDTKETFKSESMDSMALGNILFSSGTTGEPKAIPWHHSTFVKPLSDGYLHNDVRNDEVVAWPTNVGWMMGPWLISQLGLGSTIALFVGSPLSKAFCYFVEKSKIAHLGVIPSLVKAWMKTDATNGVDWSGVRRFSSTGEASNPELYHWLVSRAHYSPVMEYVGGTEIAGGYLCGTMIQPQLLSSFSCIAFGMNIYVIDSETGKEINGKNMENNEGELTISPPSIGLSVTLLNKNHYNVYYEGMPLAPNNNKLDDKYRVLRRHGDQLRVLSNGYWQHLGRCDDTMNLGGIKVSSIELENAIVTHPLLSRECAAIAYRKHEIDSEQLVVCAVPRNKDDIITITFDKRPFGFKLDLYKEDNKHAIVTSISEEKDNNNNIDLQKEYGDLVGCILYKVGSKTVYDMQYKDVIQLITSEETPITFQFVKSTFDIDKIKTELRNIVKKNINPLFKVEDLFLVDHLPRTASGKVMRRILRMDYAKAIH